VTTPKSLAAGSVAAEDAVPDPLDDKPRRDQFWATATDLGYVTETGSVSQVQVHRLFDLPETPGALKAWLTEQGYTWQDARIEMEFRHREKQQTFDGLPPPERKRQEAAVGHH
jgi:hypothetical protein